MAKRIAADISKWPVVTPACGRYDHDMVFLETESEKEARVSNSGAGAHYLHVT
jgi:hypothetical protein